MKCYLKRGKFHSTPTGSHAGKVGSLMTHAGTSKIYMGLVVWRLHDIALGCCNLDGSSKTWVILEWWRFLCRRSTHSVCSLKAKSLSVGVLFSVLVFVLQILSGKGG